MFHSLFFRCFSLIILIKRSFSENIVFLQFPWERFFFGGGQYWHEFGVCRLPDVDKWTETLYFKIGRRNLEYFQGHILDQDPNLSSLGKQTGLATFIHTMPRQCCIKTNTSSYPRGRFPKTVPKIKKTPAENSKYLIRKTALIGPRPPQFVISATLG